MGGYPAIFGRIGGNLWAHRQPLKMPENPYFTRLSAIAPKSDRYCKYCKYRIGAARPLDAAAALPYIAE